MVSSAGAENEALIHRFYEAFARREAGAMAECYAAGATFEDPAFGRLEGAEVPAMWRMLCERGEDLQVSHRDVHCTGTEGRAHWEADYTFSRTGRPVHNEIEARFTFADGLISSHRDSFGMWRWTRQALGPVGLIAGWTPMLQAAFRRQARAQLSAFDGGRTAV